MGKFQLNKDSKIILYGAASIGQIVKGNLEKNNFKIYSFVDKRSEELGYIDDIPVTNLDGISKLLHKDDYIVIISVKNVFEHDKVAFNLIKIGFYNIIFKSNIILQGGNDTNFKALSAAYDTLVESTYIDCLQLPQTKSMKNVILKDYSIIKDEIATVVVNVPIELIFSNKQLDSANPSRWLEIPMLFYYPHIDFFRYLAGDVDKSLNSYLEFCAEAAVLSNVLVTDSWQKNVIKNRCDVFNQMQLNYDLDSDFFIRNSPNAVWNKLGFFNLTSGKHRVAFLLSKKKNFIPLRISKQDYKTWLSTITKEEIHKVENSYNYNFSFLPSHPFLLRYNENVNDIFTRNALINACNYLSENLEKYFSLSKIAILNEYLPENLLVNLLKNANSEIVNSTYFKNQRNIDLLITNKMNSIECVDAKLTIYIAIEKVDFIKNYEVELIYSFEKDNVNMYIYGIRRNLYE